MPSGLIPKSFRNEAFKREVPVIVYEAGESMRFDEFAIQEGIKGIRRVMQSLGMIGGKREENAAAVELSGGKWLRARKAGMFCPKVLNGQQVKKGEVLGTITDPQNSHNTLVKSPDDGHIICINHSPVVNQGDAILRVGIAK